jgi:aspartyl-tRNA(Asn)/glutamyl-tRNA(Gln) amidotransferase subunit B
MVTGPDLRTPPEAFAFLTRLKQLLLYLEVNDGNMEEGSLRCDANISLRPAGSTELGTKTELKNMNSFRFLERGVEAELARQRGLVESGGKVEQETLHFDPAGGSLTSLRSKEEAHDYRYFPEPDLVPLAPTAEMIREARDSLPELPAARIERYVGIGLSTETASLLAADPETAAYFERVDGAVEAEPKVAANWVTGELAAALRQAGGEEAAAGSRVEPDALAALIGLVQEKKISHGSGKTVLAALVAEGGDPAAIVEREGLAQMSSDSGELDSIVAAAIEANPEAAEQIRAGNGKAIGAIVGFVMKETKGRADGGEVNRLIKEKLG